MRHLAASLAPLVTMFSGCVVTPPEAPPDELVGACTPTDAASMDHAPSQARGMIHGPIPGGLYAPALAGCELHANGIAETTYDTLGRAIRGVGIDSGSTYTWDDAGCLIESTFDTAGDQSNEGTSRFVCDNHGYPICAERPGEPLEEITNTYDDEGRLVESVSARERNVYTWDGDRVVRHERESLGTTWVYTAEWVGDVMVAGTSTSGATNWSWSSTLDEEGRVATTTNHEGDVYTYEYGPDDWPVTVYDADGERQGHYAAVCP